MVLGPDQGLKCSPETFEFTYRTCLHGVPNREALPTRKKSGALGLMSDFISLEQFLQEYTRIVDEGDAAVFAGAGLSRSAGFVDWKNLLKAFADELGLDLDVETDFPAVAQYHLNREGRVRARLNQRLTDELNRKAELSEAHTHLAELPITTFWTSNYDSLIEDALRASGRTPAVRRTGASLTNTRKGANAEVLKMHGDIQDADRVVITKEDYERYSKDNEPLLIRLKNDLISKSFLFVGFSFSDPNLELILSQVRLLVGDSPRSHYAVFKKPSRDEYSRPAKFRYELNRWQLRLGDLRRYGIQPVIVSDYDEIPDLLRQIRLRVQRRRVLVSGSYERPEVDAWSKARLDEFCWLLGRRLIASGRDLVNGFGLGVGSPLISGAVEELYRSGATSMERRLLLRPFPQRQPRGVTRAEFWTRYRQDLIAPAGFAVFIAGNKLDGNGELIPADGVKEEFDIAVSQGKYVLPIGATGSVSADLWSTVMSDIPAYLPSRVPKRPLHVLGRSASTNGQILDALLQLMDWLTNGN